MGLFDGILDYEFETVDLAILGSLILLEAILSFDNAAILAAMVSRLPREQRRKALLYGLAGAYFFRVVAILFASLLIENVWLRLVGGGYLVFLLIRHFYKLWHHSGDGHKLPPARILGLSPFWSTIVLIEAADLVFALDQIVVAVAFTKKIPLIIIAAFAAILALRLAAVYIVRLIDWFPQLEHLAYLAVGWVGGKLLYEEFAKGVLGYADDFHVPKMLSVGVTVTILVVPVIIKFILTGVRARRRRGGALGGPDTEQAP